MQSIHRPCPKAKVFIAVQKLHSEVGWKTCQREGWDTEVVQIGIAALTHFFLKGINAVALVYIWRVIEDVGERLKKELETEREKFKSCLRHHIYTAGQPLREVGLNVDWQIWKVIKIVGQLPNVGKAWGGGVFRRRSSSTSFEAQVPLLLDCRESCNTEWSYRYSWQITCLYRQKLHKKI